MVNTSLAEDVAGVVDNSFKRLFLFTVIKLLKSLNGEKPTQSKKASKFTTEELVQTLTDKEVYCTV